MDEDRAAELLNKAHSFFFKMVNITEERDVDKMATCFYSFIKYIYGMAKDQNIYEEDKEEIDDTLKGMMVLIKAMFIRQDWTQEMMEEFDEKVMKLWIID